MCVCLTCECTHADIQAKFYPPAINLCVGQAYGGSWVFLEQGNNPTVINTSCGAEDHTHSARSSTNVHSSFSESDAAHALRCPNMSFFFFSQEGSNFGGIGLKY